MPRITDIGIRADFNNRLEKVDLSQGLGKAVIMIPSTLPAGSAESYAWLCSSPSFRKWVGERRKANPTAFSLQISNEKFENGISIPLDLINNDKIGAVQMLMEDMLATYPLWVVELICGLINAGESLNAFDGQAFFSATHAYALTGTFSNLLTNTTANPADITPLEAAISINKWIEALKGMPDDQGRKIRNSQMTEVLAIYQPGTVNAAAIQTALTSQMLSSGAGMVDNPLKGQPVKITPVSNGLITTGNTKITLLRPSTDRGRAMVFQENSKDRAVDLLGNGSDYAVNNDAWFLGLKAVGNAGFGMPADAVRGTFV